MTAPSRIVIVGHLSIVGLVVLALTAASAQGQLSHDQPAATNAVAGAIVKKLLRDARYKKTTWKGAERVSKEPYYRGQPLSRFLRNKATPGTLTLDQMFTLEQVITGDEPEVVTYQLPISYDALATMGSGSVTNALDLGELKLLMDSDPDDSFLNDPELTECSRATNGDCLLAWNTAFERPGQHAMQALFTAQVGVDRELQVKGPVKPFSSSNLCRFIPASTLWDDDGAFLDA